MSTAAPAAATIICTTFAISGTMLLLTGDKVTTRLLALLGTLALIVGACIALSVWANGGVGASGLAAQIAHAALPFWTPPAELAVARWTPYWTVVVVLPVFVGYLLSQVCEAIPESASKRSDPDPASLTQVAIHGPADKSV